MEGETNLESTLRDLVAIMKKKAPNLRPSIFPSQFSARTVIDLCANKAQEDAVKAFMQTRGMEEDATLLTEVDAVNRRITITGLDQSAPLDSQLRSLEYMMRAFVLGTREELNILTTRFLEANRYEDEGDSFHVLQEVYNIAHSIKVSLSNIPNVSVCLCDKVLPLGESDDLDIILGSLVKDQSDVDVDESSEEENLQSRKRSKSNGESSTRRKKKRGCGGKYK